MPLALFHLVATNHAHLIFMSFFSRRLGSGLCSKVQEDLINFFSMIVIVALVSIDLFRGLLLSWFQFFRVQVSQFRASKFEPKALPRNNP